MRRSEVRFVGGLRVPVVGLGRCVVSWLVAVGVLASVLLAVPLASPVVAAPGDGCDSDGDGFVDGVESLIVSDGRDRNADTLSDRFDVDLGSIEDPDRWFVTVCVGSEDAVLDGPTRGLSPNAPFWEEEARINALAEARKDFYRPYPWIMPDHGGLQTVNAESWLAVDPVVYEPGNRRIVADAEVSGVRVEVVAVAVGAEFVFSDGVTVVCPIDSNIVYDAALLPDVPCGRDWEEPSERGEVSFEVGIQYEFTWTSSLGNVSPAAATVVSNPLSEFELEVTEIQAFLSEDGASVPAVPEFGRLPSVREGDDGCSGFTIIFKPDCIASFVVEQILENLPPAVRAVIETVVDFVEGCVDYGIDAAGDIISSLGQVVEFARDPDAFVNEKWAQAQQMYNALQEDPEAFVTELTAAIGESELRTDLLEAGEYTQWAGYMGCKAIVAFLTGGASSSKLVLAIQDVINTKFDGVDLPNRKPGDDNDPNGDGDGDNCPITGCGCNSFPAGTPVLMADGSHVPIELVRPGDRVLTYNTGTGVWSGNDVLAQWSGIHTDPMVTVTLTDGSQVSSTDDHLFWVTSDGAWIEADQLQPGDLLLTPDGVAPIASVTTHEPLPTRVWELDTAIDDTFTVTTGDRNVLVHNADCTFTDNDGNTVRRLEDGSEIVYRTDGSVQYTEIYNGQRLVYEGVRTDSQGNVVKDSRGNPIYDTADDSSVAIGSRSNRSDRLVLQEDGTWISESGLEFGSDDVYGDRVDHVLQHAEPLPRKPSHSIFGGNPIDVVDDAFARALAEGILPSPQNNGNYIYKIPLDGAGFDSSGSVLDYVVIVVEPVAPGGGPGRNVVTAFPTGNP